MASKELTHEELEAIVAAKMDDPNATAADILSTILAAHIEHAQLTGNAEIVNWINASPLGEQSE